MPSIRPSEDVLTHPQRRQRRRSKATLAALAVLSGGSLFGTCEMRFRSAVVDSTRGFLLTDVLPAVLGEILPDVGGADGS